MEILVCSCITYRHIKKESLIMSTDIFTGISNHESRIFSLSSDISPISPISSFPSFSSGLTNANAALNAKTYNLSTTRDISNYTFFGCKPLVPCGYLINNFNKVQGFLVFDRKSKNNSYFLGKRNFDFKVKKNAVQLFSWNENLGTPHFRLVSNEMDHYTDLLQDFGVEDTAYNARFSDFLNCAMAFNQSDYRYMMMVYDAIKRKERSVSSQCYLMNVKCVYRDHTHFRAQAYILSANEFSDIFIRTLQDRYNFIISLVCPNIACVDFDFTALQGVCLPYDFYASYIGGVTKRYRIPCINIRKMTGEIRDTKEAKNAFYELKKLIISSHRANIG